MLTSSLCSSHKLLWLMAVALLQGRFARPGCRPGQVAQEELHCTCVAGCQQSRAQRCFRRLRYMLSLDSTCSWPGFHQWQAEFATDSQRRLAMEPVSVTCNYLILMHCKRLWLTGSDLKTITIQAEVEVPFVCGACACYWLLGRHHAFLMWCRRGGSSG